MGRFVLLLALLIVALIAWSWFLPIDAGERHFVDGGFVECKAGIGFLESIQQFFRNLTRGIAIVVIGIAILVGAVQAMFNRSASGPDRVSAAQDAWEGFEGIGMGLAIIGGAIACVATLGGMSKDCTGAAPVRADAVSAESFLDFEADRATRAVRTTWSAEGIAGLRENVAECYSSARNLRTERAAMFCFAFDYLTATRYDTQGSESDRVAAVRARTGSLLDHDGLHTTDRGITLDAWTDAANRAYGGSPSASSPASRSSSMQCMPSFDCATDRRFADQLVCSTADLCESDRRMAALYDEARANSDAATSARIKDEQRIWWSSRRNACTDADCLRQAYRDRIRDLSRTQETAADNPAADDAGAAAPQAPVSPVPDLYCRGVLDYARARARGAREYARGRGLASAGPEGDWRYHLSPEDLSRCSGMAQSYRE